MRDLIFIPEPFPAIRWPISVSRCDLWPGGSDRLLQRSRALGLSSSMQRCGRRTADNDQKASVKSFLTPIRCEKVLTFSISSEASRPLNGSTFAKNGTSRVRTWFGGPVSHLWGLDQNRRLSAALALAGFPDPQGRY